MSAEELIVVARWGLLTCNDLVRCGASGTWVRASLVRGLFDSTPSTASAPSKLTVSSAHTATAGGGATPGKRSVHSFVATHYWVKFGQVGAKADGPFTSRQIRQFAEQGVLKPSDMVSKDGRLWARACNVHGLVFGTTEAVTETLIARSTVATSQPPASANCPTADIADCSTSGEIPIQLQL